MQNTRQDFELQRENNFTKETQNNRIINFDTNELNRDLRDPLARRRSKEILFNNKSYQDEASDTQQFVQTKPNPKVIDEDFITPSLTTMQFVKEKDIFSDARAQVQNEAENESKSFSTGGLKPQSKLIILVYTIVIAVLLILIILNSAALASLSKSTSALDERVQALTVENNQRLSTLNGISNDAYIGNIAVNELDMEEGAAVYETIKMPEINYKPNLKKSTNWFDKFCGLFS